ncbi:hypothetical protein GCM10010129_00420 [Streptomyces fumigatiscleroticus]|nr:hypothetical protein GCM10010129_00420 [Streptomyces fumigatiscleroticus]
MTPGGAGQRAFVVRPDTRTGGNRARTAIRTGHGQARVSWSGIDRPLRLTARVPAGSTADVPVPGESRSHVTTPPRRRFPRTEPRLVVIRAPYGRWEFTGRA